MLNNDDFLADPLREGVLQACSRGAKKLRRMGLAQTHTGALDLIATRVGYGNWSQVARAMEAATGVALLRLSSRLGRSLAEVRVYVARSVGEEVMEDFVWRHYSQLQEFAFYDSEAENGYAWPSVELADELEDAFSGIFQDELINEVGNRLDAEEGPFGVEEYGRV